MDILDSRDLQDMLDDSWDRRPYLNEIIRIKNATEAAGWDQGIQFIAVSDFKEYTQALADDLGLLDTDYPWPYCCIDWTQAARELAYDYSLISFDGVDYYYREA